MYVLIQWPEIHLGFHSFLYFFLHLFICYQRTFGVEAHQWKRIYFWICLFFRGSKFSVISTNSQFFYFLFYFFLHFLMKLERLYPECIIPSNYENTANESERIQFFAIWFFIFVGIISAPLIVRKLYKFKFSTASVFLNIS